MLVSPVAAVMSRFVSDVMLWNELFPMLRIPLPSRIDVIFVFRKQLLQVGTASGRTMSPVSDEHPLKQLSPSEVSEAGNAGIDFRDLQPENAWELIFSSAVGNTTFVRDVAFLRISWEIDVNAAGNTKLVTDVFPAKQLFPKPTIV